MKTLNTLSAGIVIGGLGLSGSARAESPLEKLEVGAFIGYHWWNDDNELGRDNPAQDPIDDSFVLGIRGGMRFHKMASAEGELAVLPASTRDNDGSVTAIGYRLNALVHPKTFVDNKLEPFGLIGLGGSSSFSDEQYVTDDTDFVWHFGAGARYFLRDDLGLRLDLKLLVPPGVVDTATMDAEVTLGVFKTFGKKDIPTVVTTEVSVGDGDADKDGIPDSTDVCKDQPETVNQFKDDDGCPDELPQELKAFTGVIKGVEFETNSDKLRPTSSKVLDQAVKVLKDFPDIKLEISGHTDNTGKAEYNRDLSQRRAESVKSYLVVNGIDESRLEAVGHGPDKPIADNGTPAGRQQNRRVEFATK